MKFKYLWFLPGLMLGLSLNSAFADFGAAQGNAGGGGAGVVETITETGSGLTVDSTDPANPVLSLGAVLEAIANLSGTDNQLVRMDGTGDLQASDATLSDAELLDLTVTGALVLGSGTNDVRLEKGTTNRWHLRSGDDDEWAGLVGNLLVAADSTLDVEAALTAASLTAANTRLAVLTNGAAPIRLRAASDTAGEGNILQAARFSGTNASPTAVESGDLLLAIAARGAVSASATGDLDMAQIQFLVDGAVGLGDAPGRIDFLTNTDGSGNSSTLKWSITNAGHLLAGTDNSWDVGASGATRPRMVYAGTSFLAPDGSDAAPSLAFASDTNTGFFRDSADNLAVTTGGTTRGVFNNAGLSMTSGGFLQVSNTASAPAYAVASTELDTGMFSPAASAIGWSVDETEELRLTATGLDRGADQVVFGASIGSPDVGLERSAAGVLRVSDGSTGDAILYCEELILGQNASAGFRLAPIGNGIRLEEGDGTDLATGDAFILGLGGVTGRAMIQVQSGGNPGNPGHSFEGDANTGFGRLAADAPAIAANGRWRTIWGETAGVDGSAVNLCTIPLAAGETVSGVITIHMHNDDGAESNVIIREWSFVVADDTGTLASSIDGANNEVAPGTNTPGGPTIDVGPTFNFTDGTNAITLTLQVGYTGTPTITYGWELRMYHSTTGVAVTIP